MNIRDWWRGAVLRKIEELEEWRRGIEAYRDKWYLCSDTLGYQRLTLGMEWAGLRIALCEALLPEERKAREEE